jgi:hypothetical protein
MQIPAERAFWILDFYRRKGTPLQFGGKILREESACFAEVTEVWPEAQTVTIRLFEDDGEASWDRLISLGGAIFVFDQLGAPLFVQYAESPWHPVLHVGFPDGTTMFFAECAWFE